MRERAAPIPDSEQYLGTPERRTIVPAVALRAKPCRSLMAIGGASWYILLHIFFDAVGRGFWSKNLMLYKNCTVKY